MQIPFVDLKTQYKNIKKDIDQSLFEIIENGTFILGKPVEEFEKNISSYLDAYSLGCASGSDALLLALMASDIKEGDEVITTPFTFFATAGAVARLGAVPVFVDIDEKTFNIDPVKVEQAVSDKTRAIIPVHIFGQSVDMDPVLEICERRNLTLIEDACQAIGAEYKDKKAGTMGRFGCFSFFPTKNLGGFGDGGLITCKNEEDYKLLKKLRVHGSEKKYFHDVIGINSRLDAIQAGVLNIKLKYLDEWNTRRVEIAQKYSESLKDLVQTPYVIKDAEHIYHQYAILTKDRDTLLAHLNQNGISSGVYYPLPLHLQKCFEYLGYKEGYLPVSEKVSKEILSLPIYPEMTEAQVEYIINTVRSFFS